MTILVPGIVVKPAITAKPHNHVIQMRVVKQVHRVHVRMLAPRLLLFAVVTVGGLSALALLVTIIPNLDLGTNTRYKGYCTIPIKEISEEPSYYEQPSYKVMPLRWSSAPDVQVLSTANEDTTDNVINGLREQFDIGDSVEKISVMDNGRHVNFIHDFEANMTGIVDVERCFLKELDPETVLTPEVLVLSIEGGAHFDISRVRSTLRAALPALTRLAAGAELRDRCRDKPTYSLHKEDQLIIRKRAVDGPSHDYIQFSGRRVQEIEISNLADLLQHEQDAKRA